MKVAQLCGFIFLFGSLSCVQERGEATAPSDALTTRTAALEQAREPVDRRAEALWQAIQQSAAAKQRVRLFVRVEGDRAPLRTFVTARGAHIAYEYTLLPDVVAVREFPMSQLDDLTRIKGVTELLPDGTKHAIMTESLGQIQALQGPWRRFIDRATALQTPSKERDANICRLILIYFDVDEFASNCFDLYRFISDLY